MQHGDGLLLSQLVDIIGIFDFTKNINNLFGSKSHSQTDSSTSPSFGECLEYDEIGIFIQLFEEIDIRSHWNFEQTWKNTPIPLQCLTLTRVLEEALTNIVKHSQASEVNISLTETENNELMMCILDNGIGFNPKTVEAGLHVGLQSMQARIHRLGGEFKIDSQPGKTSIQVLLPLTINKINRDVF